jgi:signal transduction histidine kinase
VLTVASELALTLPLAAQGGPPPVTFVVIALVRCLFFLPVGYAVARLARAQREQGAALAEARARLAESRERDRLAHELHDTLAHGLSSVAVQLEAMRTLWISQPERARSMLAEALEATRTALGEARRAIAALRASPLEDLGLAAAIRRRAESDAARAGFALDLDLSPLESVDAEVEHAVYRIATEALANIVRHAQARRVTLKLERAGPMVRLLVADDGRGFDPSGAPDEGRFGLRGMRERSRIIGAALEIESAPGKGTAVRLTVPER